MKKLVKIFLLCLAVTAVASDTTKTIMDFWNEQYTAFQVGNPEKIVLMLGDTGTGKSSLALLLTDAILEATRDSKDGSLFLIKDRNEKIGSITGNFRTITPEPFIDQNNNITYYDCPRFEDTRSPDHDIIIGYLVEKLLTHAKSFKIVLVVNHSSVKKSETQSIFPNFIEKIIKLLKHIDDYKDGIAMVSTKVAKTGERVEGKLVPVNDVSVVVQIADYLKELQDKIIKQMSENDMPTEEREFNEEKMDLLNVLLENNGRTDNSYDRLAIFRRPSKPGLLSNDGLIKKEKLNMQKMIRENLKFVGQNKNMKYGLVVSTKSYVYINALVQRIVNTELLNDISSITNRIGQFYKSILENTHDFTMLNSTLNDSGNFLDGIKSNETLAFTKELVQKARNVIDDSLRNNVHKHIEYIEFLLKNEKQSLRTPDTFTQQLVEAKLYIKTQYDTNVDRWVKNLLQVTMFSTVKAISTEIQERYTNVEKGATDVYLLREKLSKAHEELSKVDLLKLQSFVETLEDLEITVKNENLNKLKDLVRKIEDVSELVEKNRNSIVASTVEVKGVLQGLKESVLWYDYMIILDSNLPFPTIKTIPSETDIIQRIINACDNANNVDQLSFNALSPFVPENDKKINILKDVHLNPEKKKKLKTILSSFVQKPTVICSEGNVMTVTGPVIRMSEVTSDVNVTCFSNATSIEIFASTSVVIDSSFEKTATNLSMAIMSPVWTVVDSQSILLRGPDGKSKEKAPDCNIDCSTQHDGEAGNPGATGGNFLGIGSVFLNTEKLTISSAGGNGGRGANGGKGPHGVNGSSPPVHGDPVEEFRKCFNLIPGHRICMRNYCGKHDYKYNEDQDGYNFTFWVKGSFGTNGGRGGHGGVGGFGGKAGRINVIELDKKSRINNYSYDGTTGSHETGGQGGNAAVKRYRHSKMFTWDHEFLHSSLRSIEKTEVDEMTEPGSRGLDGGSAKNRRNPEPTHDFDHPSETITKFINYLISSLRGSFRESETRKFMIEILYNDVKVQQLINQE